MNKKSRISNFKEAMKRKRDGKSPTIVQEDEDQNITFDTNKEKEEIKQISPNPREKEDLKENICQNSFEESRKRVLDILKSVQFGEKKEKNETSIGLQNKKEKKGTSKLNTEPKGGIFETGKASTKRFTPKSVESDSINCILQEIKDKSENVLDKMDKIQQLHEKEEEYMYSIDKDLEKIDQLVRLKPSSPKITIQKKIQLSPKSIF